MSDLFFSRVDIVIRIRKNRRNLCYPSLMGNIKMLKRSRLSYLSFLFLISFSLSLNREENHFEDLKHDSKQTERRISLEEEKKFYRHKIDS